MTTPELIPSLNDFEHIEAQVKNLREVIGDVVHVVKRGVTIEIVFNIDVVIEQVMYMYVEVPDRRYSEVRLMFYIPSLDKRFSLDLPCGTAFMCKIFSTGAPLSVSEVDFSRSTLRIQTGFVKVKKIEFTVTGLTAFLILHTC